MKQETEINELINRVRALENDSIEFDEAAIHAEYQHIAGEKSSLAIKIMTIFGGLLATLTLLGFFAGAKLFESEIGCMISGVIFIAASIGLNKIESKLIIDTFSISLFVSGLSLIGIAFDQFNANDNILPLTFIGICAATLMITQRYILSFISILVINGSILGLIEMHREYQLIHIYIAIITAILVAWFLKEAKIISANKKLSRLYRPFRIGFTISYVFGLFLAMKNFFYQQVVSNTWISSVFTISASLFVVYILCNVLQVKQIKDRILVYLVSLLVLSSTAMMPAIPGSILIILLSFRVNFKTELAIGILSFIYFVSQYYYDLSFSLLTKSYMMLGTGALFLLIYLFTYKKLQAHE